MNSWIERYISDVVRRLPERERDEVSRELEANIADMLPDNPSEQEIIRVLNGLGAPSKLAEQYRQKPRYLISPAMYDLYISVMKMLIPIVAIVIAGVSVLAEIMQYSGDWSPARLFGGMVSGAVEGALQAAFWVTLGFAIAERSDTFKSKEWTVDDLPKQPAHKPLDPKGVAISRSGTITGMALTVFFTGVVTLMIVHGESFLILVRNAKVYQPFSQTALDRSLPYILVLGCLSLVVSGLKLYRGRWDIPLCTANAVYNVVWVSIVIYMLHWPDLFSTEFLEFAEVTFTAKGDILSYLAEGGTATIISAILIFIALIDTGVAGWYTWKGMQKKTSFSASHD